MAGHRPQPGGDGPRSSGSQVGSLRVACQEIDGHDFLAIGQALAAARTENERPSVIVAHTVKGKGVSFMEDDNNWHYRTPNPEELAAALAELGLP